MHRFFLRLHVYFIFTCLPFTSWSQGIKGRLTDANNNPVPYAAIYDETTYAGTTSNADGYYYLKLAPGSHSLVYKAMGYYLERRKISTSDQVIILNLQLAEQPVQIKEAIVTPGKEDPAYPIMRKVISLAPFHLNQVKAFTADVYLRGTIQVIKMPKFIAKHTEVNGKKNVLKTGDVYIQESLNQIHFRAPQTYDQKVISYHSTFPEENNQVNPMGVINSSFYQPKIDDFISPLAPDAFSVYTYHYEGFFEESGKTIFKIRVTPKHNSQQLMNGYIYIVDKSWNLHSADVTVHMFFGDLSYKIIYSPVKPDAWLPISYQFYADASLMGVKINFKYSSSLNYKQVTLDEKLIAKTQPSDEQEKSNPVPGQSKTEPKKQKGQQEIEKLMAKDDLTNHDMVKLATLISKEQKDTSRSSSLELKNNNTHVTIDKDAVKKDSTYWDTIRPIPLTKEEALIHLTKDSMATVAKDSMALADSMKTARAHEKVGKIISFLLTGKSFPAFDSTLMINYKGIIGFNKIVFNTVDGFIYRQTFSLEQRIDSSHNLIINPAIAYAFSRNQLMWWNDIEYSYFPMRNGNIHLHIGSGSADYNPVNGLNPTINTLASLFFRRNYLKLYQQNQLYLTNKIDLANGLNLSATIGYQTARPLANHSDYSFFYRSERDYSANIPVDDSSALSRNLTDEEAYWEATLEFTPRYYYRLQNGHKIYQHSKYPTFFVRNRMAVPGIVKSTADYDLFETGVRQKIEWGFMHAFSWSVKGGIYLNQNKIFLTDDKYFNNQNLPVVLDIGDDAFRLAPFYRNSTTDKYAEAHLRFTTPYLLVKYLPFLENKLWCENIHLNYLTTPGLKNYWEAGYSISQIYMAGSIGVYAGFRGSNFQSYGVQVSFDF